MKPLDLRLLRLVPEVRPALVGLALAAVVHGLAGIGVAICVAALVVTVVQPDRTDQLVGGLTPGTVTGWLVTVFVLRAVASGATEVLAARAGALVSIRVRSAYLRALYATPVKDRSPVDESEVLASSGAGAIEPYVARFLPTFVAAAVVPPAAIVTMLVIDWRAGLVPVLTVPLLPLFAALIGASTAEATQRRWSTLTALSGHFVDVMKGLPTLVTYGRAERQTATIRRVSHDHRRASVETLRLAFLSSAALELLATISVAIVAVLVGIRLANGSMELALALPCILVAPEAYWPIRRVGAEFHAAADGVEALRGMLDVMESPRAHPSRPQACPTSIRARGLQYRYPGGERDVIAGLDLDIGPGLTVVTGASGAGKTTLLELIAGLRAPTRGEISAPATHLVTQRPFLAPRSVRDNLALGADDHDDEAIGVALERLGLSSVVTPETVLGDDGFGLSAGQRARLALARALLSTAPVILLDEPTAHLDADSETLIHTVIGELARTRPVIAVSHRAGLIALADHVVELPALPGPADDGNRNSGPTGRRTAPEEDSTPAPVVAPESVSDSGSTLPPTLRLRPVPGVLGAGLLGGLALTSGVALTATSGWLIVAASHRPQILTLLAAIVAVRAFGIARPCFRYWERIRSHDAALAFLAEQRAATYAALIPLTPARLGRRARGDLLAGVVDDLDDLAYAQVRVVVPAVAVLVAGGAAALLAALVLTPAALVVLALLALVILVGLAQWRVECSVIPGLVRDRAEVAALVSLNCRSMTEIAAVGGIDDALGWLEAAQSRATAQTDRQARGRALGVVLVPLAVVASVIVLAGLLSPWVDAGLPTPLAALVLLVPVALGDVVGTVPDAVGSAARARGAAERLALLLAQRPAVSDNSARASDPAGSVVAPEPGSQHAPELGLKEVTARWADSGPPATGPVTTSIGPGQVVAVVGPNGGGKSTMLAVIARHLDPLSGRYLHDQVDVRTRSVAQTRAPIAVVDDEPHVFASTLRENLRLASPTARDQEIRKALASAGLEEWASGLRDGLDTRLGTGAVGLSGGERTRLAIARALLSARPVLLLDEPVAHLDHPTAVAVMHDVRRAAHGRTLVVVAHRTEGLDDADHVVQVG